MKLVAIAAVMAGAALAQDRLVDSLIDLYCAEEIDYDNLLDMNSVAVEIEKDGYWMDYFDDSLQADYNYYSETMGYSEDEIYEIMKYDIEVRKQQLQDEQF